MTQDQYGQTRGPGYIVRGDVVPDDENEEFPTDESKPMTRFQKVATALRGAGPERDEAVAVTSPELPVPETVKDPLTHQDQMTGEDQMTGQDRPEAADHPATQPEMFGTGTHAGNGATPTPQASAAAGALGDFSDLTYGNLLPDAAQYTAQWQQVQFKFVDDPHASVTEAADIIAQVTARLEAAIQERQRAIEERQRAIAERQRSLRGRWGEGTNADTEGLRETLRMYRTFLDQLIGPRAG
jgi:hypothetical protein